MVGQKCRQSKHRKLLDELNVREWYESMARGSPQRAYVDLSSLGWFCTQNGVSPKGLAALGPWGCEDLFRRLVARMEAQGRAPCYIKSVLRAVSNWLRWNGVEVIREIKVSNPGERPARKRWAIPGPEGLLRSLSHGNARGRAILGLMAFAALPPEVMGNYSGIDGLRVKNLIEAHLKEGELLFNRVPTRILVPEHLSKLRHEYFTFLGPEGCQYLRAYFQQRRARGEALTEESPVITRERWVTPYSRRDAPFVRRHAQMLRVRDAMRQAGLLEPPYIWRHYFSNRSMLAEGRGWGRDYREFVMGHYHASEIARLYVRTGGLDQEVIEAMRRGYQAALLYLETVRHTAGSDPIVEILSLSLAAAGYLPDGVEAMKLNVRDREDLVKLVDELRLRFVSASNGRSADGTERQLVGIEHGCAICGFSLIVHQHHINDRTTIPLCPNCHYSHHDRGIPLIERGGHWFLGDQPPGPQRDSQVQVTNLRALKARIQELCAEGHPALTLLGEEPNTMTRWEFWELLPRLIRLMTRYPVGASDARITSTEQGTNPARST